MHLSEQMPRPALYLSFFHFDQRMLTSTSEHIRKEGWHFSSKGYFSIEKGRKEKARMGSIRAEFGTGKLI